MRAIAPPSATPARAGPGPVLIGVLSLACAAVSTMLAGAHGAAQEAACGGHVLHCGWCLSAAGFALFGLTALFWPNPQPVRRCARGA